MSNYAIVDLEMCHIPKGIKKEAFRGNNEIIQIGAVLLDESLKTVSDFMTYVHPEFGTVDTYIENLTGISNKDTENAPCAKEALETFVSWLPDDVILISWSETDEKQIRKEIEGKNISIPRLDKYLDNWVDCQKTFSEKMNSSKVYRLSDALNICAIDAEDCEHDALADACNTAKLFAKMQREPNLKLSPYYVKAEEVKVSTYNPFANLLANYDNAG